MGLKPGQRIADLGCGVGTSAIFMADTLGLMVEALDASSSNIEYAQAKLLEQPVQSGAVNFIHGNAEHLPWQENSLDAAIAECTLSLFPDKPAVLKSLSCCLRPGAPFVVTDMVIGAGLPDHIKEQMAPWTCLSDALSREGYIQLFTDAGYQLISDYDESEGLYQLLSQVKRQLLLLAAGQAFSLSESAGFTLNLGQVRYWLQEFKTQLDAGNIHYHRFQLKSQS